MTDPERAAGPIVLQRIQGKVEALHEVPTALPSTARSKALMGALKHAFLVILRLAIAVCVVAALPVSNLTWGRPDRGDESPFGFIVLFIVFGMAVAAGYVLVASVLHVLLRRRSPILVAALDISLGGVLVGSLVYAGTTGTYSYEPSRAPPNVHSSAGEHSVALLRKLGLPRSRLSLADGPLDGQIHGCRANDEHLAPIKIFQLGRSRRTTASSGGRC